MAFRPARRLDYRSLAARGGYALAGVIGYILSPASWWNDAVVNIPLALLAARLLEAAGVPLEAGFTLAYWATNVAGMILMAVGVEGAGRGRVSRRSLLAGLAVSTVYTLAVVGVLRLLGL